MIMPMFITYWHGISFYGQSRIGKRKFHQMFEEDTEDQSGLYNVVYCFEFLDQNEEAIEYLKTYIDKKSI
jgi:hypothetical protein